MHIVIYHIRMCITQNTLSNCQIRGYAAYQGICLPGIDEVGLTPSGWRLHADPQEGTHSCPVVAIQSLFT